MVLHNRHVAQRVEDQHPQSQMAPFQHGGLDVEGPEKCDKNEADWYYRKARLEENVSRKQADASMACGKVV